MDAQFWIKAWEEGRTGFHRESYNEKLLEYFPPLKPQRGQSVLVPLCGKSKDMLWLNSQGLHVHGVELHTPAVKSFFSENHLSPVEEAVDEEFINYMYKNIVISCGNFFKLNAKDRYDFIYDRASLVALPSFMRKEYARVVTESLRVGGKYLLIVYEYDQTKMEGPPFSIEDQEIYELYQDRFEIKLMENEAPENEGPRFTELGIFYQKVFILEKLR